MLSQRIMVKALLYHETPATKLHTEIEEVLAEWQSSHQFLIDKLDQGNDIYNEKQTKERLGELTSFIQTARNLIPPSGEISHEQLKALESNQELFLQEMDQVVGLMQADSDQKLRMIITIEIIFALLSLFLIYYEITYVFKKINLRLVRKNEDLTESNELLEQYAHLASHDLRSPIQNIINFSELLLRRLKPKLGLDEIEFFSYIVEASQRLKQTTSDLLKVATIHHHELDFKWCNPKLILQEVLDDLEEQILDKKAQISIHQLPASIRVDQHTIHLAFQNLIANSLKFAKEGKTPQLEISYEDTAEQHIFLFKDKGIGIDQSDQELIFKIFRRVNEDGQYEGTGMGLAICLRMIRRLNGNIKVASQLGVGSTFKIAIPKEIVAAGVVSI